MSTELLASILNRGKSLVQHFNGPTVSVYGKAPSLSKMRNMKSTCRGAFFWYYYRICYPYIFPIIFLVFMIVALSGWNTIEGHLVLGSVLSLIGSLSVAISYIMIIPWRKHPSTLVVYRAWTSIVFSITIILEAISTNSVSCRNYAVVTHVTLLSGECWLTSIASDLVHSLTNPFASYKANLNRYLLMIWTFVGIISFVFYFDTKCQGKFDEGICWVKISGHQSPCLWGYYLVWIITMYAYQLWAFIFAYLRLKRGLSATFDIRKKCAEETFKCLMSYAIYLSVCFFIFAILSSDPNPQAGSNMANFAKFFLFIVANRGSVDGAVWFMLHDFERDPPRDAAVANEYEMVNQGKAVDPEIANTDGRSSEGSSSTHHDDGELRGINKVKQDIDEIKKKTEGAIKELADLAIAEFDESDLSPQVNMALRQQVVQYVTQGIRNAVLNEKLHDKKRKESGIDSSMERMMNLHTKDPAVTDGLQVKKFYLDEEYAFKEFAPDRFRELRLSEGIDDRKYLDILSKPANERLSEGASGAFMFFCGGGEFIVKTIRAREARVLHNSLDEYADYMLKNKKSFLCRILGSYSLRMYDQVFYFVVMMNCFDPSSLINERFDIKGSWVGRSADPVKASKRVVCRHCNTYFVPKDQEQCSIVVGKHEADVVLKDNDMRAKICLKRDEARRVVSIIKSDSDLLGKLGVLDYSLLVGVRKYKFPVEVADSEVGLIRSPDATTIPKENATFKAYSVTGPAVYHFGIVDFLQHWSFNKKLERMFKIYIRRKDRDGLSVMEPESYMDRFQGKIDQIFDLGDEDEIHVPVRRDSICGVPPPPAFGHASTTVSDYSPLGQGFQAVSSGVVNPMVAMHDNTLILQSPSFPRSKLPTASAGNATSSAASSSSGFSKSASLNNFYNYEINSDDFPSTSNVNNFNHLVNVAVDDDDDDDDEEVFEEVAH